MKRKREQPSVTKRLAVGQPYVEINALSQCDINSLTQILTYSCNATPLELPEDQLSEIINIEDIKAITYLQMPEIGKVDKKNVSYQQTTLLPRNGSNHLCHLFGCN